MFEAQVLYYLNQYLGRYVSGLDLQALRISVFQGDLELRNLRLKPEALNKLKLPITVKAGLLGSLKLKVGAHCSGRSLQRRTAVSPSPPLPSQQPGQRLGPLCWIGASTVGLST